MVGATGTTSREWNAVEMVAHDSTSFTWVVFCLKFVLEFIFDLGT
jgi:hypothetical protein